MPVKSIFSRGLVSIGSRTTIQEAAQLMKSQHIGVLVVLQAAHEMKPTGILTDRDLALAMADNLPYSTPVEQIMSRKVVTIYEDESIATAAHRMRSEGVRRLVVIDSSDRATGLLSADDVLQRVAHEISDLGCLVAIQPMQEASLYSSHRF